MGSSFSRNRLINPGFAVDQRNAGASQTITAGAALAYTVDRWYAYCIGANVTGQRVTGAVANTYRYQFTGAASVTAIGFAQRIEALNSADLAGKTVTLSVDLANSLLTTVTWTAYYANTADTFGTLASPTRTQIATGTFTVNSSVTRYSTNISVSSSSTTGIEVVFTVSAQTSGTWTIGNVQLEEGTIATPFELRLNERQLCQRYYFRTTPAAAGDPFGTGYASLTTAALGTIAFPVEMQTAPTALEQSGTASHYRVRSGNGTDTACSSVPTFSSATKTAAQVTFTVASGLTAGQGVLLRAASASGYLGWSAEL